MSKPGFNSPPGWPTPPAGWTPPEGWHPDPSWPAAPAGWEFWSAPPARSKKRMLWIIAGATAIVVFLGAGTLALNSLGGQAVDQISADNEAADPDSDEAWERMTMAEATAELQAEHDKTLALLSELQYGIDGVRVMDSSDENFAEGVAQTTPLAMRQYIDQYAYMRKSMQRDYDNWVEVFAPNPDNLVNKSGTVAEAELIRVSGGQASMSIDNECAEAFNDISGAVACVQSASMVGPSDNSTVVHVPQASIDNPAYADRWGGFMLHEFAHVIQNKYLFKLEASADYINLFGENIETHADCMAVFINPAHSIGYQTVCSPEQVASAGRVWDGITG